MVTDSLGNVLDVTGVQFVADKTGEPLDDDNDVFPIAQVTLADGGELVAWMDRYSDYGNVNMGVALYAPRAVESTDVTALFHDGKGFCNESLQRLVLDFIKADKEHGMEFYIQGDEDEDSRYLKVTYWFGETVIDSEVFDLLD